MSRIGAFFRRFLRSDRESRVRRQLAEFERINPDLLKDIGLHANNFRDVAESIEDSRRSRSCMRDGNERNLDGAGAQGVSERPAAW